MAEARIDARRSCEVHRRGWVLHAVPGEEYSAHVALLCGDASQLRRAISCGTGTWRCSGNGKTNCRSARPPTMQNIFAAAARSSRASNSRFSLRCERRRWSRTITNDFYAEGRIREDARAIWEAIGENGPLATLELRNICKMDSKAGNVRFKRAVADLQCVLVLVHFGTEQETGAWASARYELTCRAFPKETAAARKIAPGEARRMLAAKFVACYPGAAHGQVARLFGWTKVETAAAMEYAGDRRITKAGKRK